MKCQYCNVTLDGCYICDKPFEIDKISLKTNITIVGIVVKADLNNVVHLHICSYCLKNRIHFSRVVDK